jgi:hypothetical protein
VRCRTNAKAKPHPHACSSWHRTLVDSYQCARDAQEARLEEWAMGYAAEIAAFYETVERRIVFKDWLLGNKREEAPA